MDLAGFLLILAMGCAIVAAVSAILVTAALDRREIITPFPLIGLFLFRNLRRYRVITLEETGRVGPLFYLYVIPINVAWMIALLALAVHLWF